MTEEDEELEMLRRKRLDELQASGKEKEAIRQERERQEEMKNQILLMILTREAKERLNRVKIAYPELANMVENQLIMLYQNGRLPGEVDDNTLKRILQQVQPESKEIKIVRK